MLDPPDWLAVMIFSMLWSEAMPLYRTLDLYCVPQFLASVMLYVKSSLEELSWLSVKIWWKFLNIYPQERKYNTEYKLSTA